MKKSVKILAVALVLVMVCLSFAACGKKLSGKYSAEAVGTGTTLEFKGSKVTLTVKVLGVSGDPIEGTYKIEDDKITFDFDSDDEEAKKFNKALDFEEQDDGDIKIGIIEYKKAD
ncbi:MAG: hypothetical protein E7668_06465 [Ruminococcaceae bacterium]|nr:hypothetical protein [Oscillospiraceae bacterium]